ncbi:metallophosphoesterase [Chitinasiproducens palmae]|uniref:Serine/threonine protein phosphatase 1 n=1 Tax=Chitinasiproducens palmae TaxID=1770053 RepID=A0A1H2PRJ8_9BURK|nr:metallophosphoesterase [Chitinasiproducens palmae]SDV49092.1 serine/threonine protein phosphatase 1 [Chitinasiproducens palmae]
MTVLYKRFVRNTVGRDFAVGDIHGCFRGLERALAQVSFDPSCDRLFSVGDLVDRGPDSDEAVEWIAKPFFHAVRGNHEQMAIGVASGRYDRDTYLRNGGGWFLALAPWQQRAVAEVFDMLPLAIEIEAERGAIGIVHADIAGQNWTAFRTALLALNATTPPRALMETTLWSRERAARRNCDGVPDLLALIVGHTPMTKPERLGNVHYIDTGAVFGRQLTMIDLGTLFE